MIELRLLTVDILLDESHEKMGIMKRKTAFKKM